MAETRTPPEFNGNGYPTRESDDTRTTGSGPSASRARPLPVIGDYRILHRIGAGGMGIVYEAEQQHPRRKVAVKIVRGGEFVDETRVRMFQRASPPSRTHRFAKFVRRHKMGVGAATAGLMMLLVFAVTMTVQAARIARERDQTRLEAATANQALDFLTGLFEVSNPSEARGNSITAREILDKGAAEIEKSLSDQPVARARLMSTMGEVYLGLGLHSAAEPLLVRSAEIRRRELGDDHPDTLESINKVGAVFHYQGKLDEAEAYLREALERRRRALGGDHFRTVRTMGNVGELYTNQGRYDEAEVTLLEAHGILAGTLGVEDGNTQKIVAKLAALYEAWDRPDEAGRWRAELSEK